MKRTKAKRGRRYRADLALERGKPAGKKTKSVLMGHAIKRAFERYDLRLTTADVTAMNRAIRTNKGTFIESQSASRSAWIVPLNGREYPVIYNKAIGCVSTILPQYVLAKWKTALDTVPDSVLE